MTTVRAFTEEPSAQRRAPLLETGLALVEDVASHGPAGSVGAEGFSPEAQLVLPYSALFIWEVGRDAVVGDPNQALFVAPGEEFRMRHPLPGGYAELIVTPGEPLLEELTGGSGRSVRLHPLFRLRARRIDPRLQLARARFLGLAAAGVDALEAEEQLLSLLRTTLGEERRIPRLPDPALPCGGGHPAPRLPDPAPAGASDGRAATRRGPHGGGAGAGL